MGRYKKYLTIFLIFSVYMIPFQTNAGTIGGWTYSNPISKGASAVISATKNVVINGKDFIKTGSATITPTAAQVAKTFGKTAGALALTIAIDQMLGAVDWVIDSENNTLKYSSPSSYNDPSHQYYYQLSLWDYSGYYSTISELCAKVKTVSGWQDVQCRLDGNNIYAFQGASSSSYGNVGYRVSNPSYNPAAPDNSQPKIIPLTNVAQRVIDNAKTGEPKAQAAIMQAATDILAEAETDSTKARPITSQLEQSAETKPADAADALKQNTGTAKTTNPDGSVAESEFEMPVACTWMPIVCEAASVVINKPVEWAQDIKAAYDDAVDYFKSEPEQTDNTLDIGEENQTQPDTTISFQTSCPAKIPLTFNWNGQTLDFSFDFTIWCESISTFVYPIVVALGSLHALYIVAGVRQDG
ncbi:virulence factor TspB C-terminal domain-related protein [uncultured Acinetobacter sp.]|uniref:virulence factor TspB C-terminal domain-related protein n=1 Tax=uncultured Acinetobacter sp. TaxID=165433 RepID=UPI002588025D|nr:virulence factor TspB C-terminal domain-related protein [uncultured Acinetobacter sp.]